MKHWFLFVSIIIVSSGLFSAEVWEQPTMIRQNHNLHWTKCASPADDGGVVYVWSDGGSGSRDIYASRYDNQGNAVWTQPVAISNKPKLQEYPAISKTSTGDFIIAWADYTTSLNGSIFIQKVSATGVVLWQDGGIEMSSNVHGCASAQVVPDLSGGAYIVWHDMRSDNRDIYAQRVDGNGNFMWQTGGLPLVVTPTDEKEFVACPDYSGGLYLGYCRRVGATSRYTLYVTHYNATGAFDWPAAVNLSGFSVGCTQIQTAFINDATVVFSWTESTVLEDNSTIDYNIKAQGINLSGNLLWQTPLDVYSDLNSARLAQRNPQIVSSGNNSVIIAWAVHWSVSSNTRLCAQKINLAGEKLWPEEAIEVTTGGYLGDDLSVIPFGNGGFAISWYDNRTGHYPNRNIYAQAYDQTGTALWETGGKEICMADDNQDLPLFVKSGNYAYLAWCDVRCSSAGIYYQVLSSTGQELLTDDGRQVFQGITTSAYSNLIPVLLPINDGTAVIWMDSRFGDEQKRIYLQIVNGDGSTRLAPNGICISENPDNDHTSFKAIVTPEGNLAIVWIESVNYDSDRCYAQLFDVDGNRLWGNAGIEIKTEDFIQILSADISYSDGSVYIVWNQVYYNNDLGFTWYRILGQRIANGQKQWGEDGILISALPAADVTQCLYPIIRGRYVVWQEGENQPQNIRARMMTVAGTSEPGWLDSGNAITNLEPQNGFVNNTRAELIAGRLAVIWLSRHDGGTIEVHCQLITPAGTNHCAEIIIPTHFTSYYLGSLVTFLSGDNLAFIWTECLEETTQNSILLNMINQNGELLLGDTGSTLIENSCFGNNNDIAGFTGGGCILSWDEFLPNDYYKLRVGYRYFNSDGTHAGPSEGFFLTHGTNSCSTPRLGRGNNCAFIAWSESNRHLVHDAYYDDGLNDNLGMFLQKLSNECVALDEDLAVPKENYLRQNYPNPFNPETQIGFDLKSDTQVELTVFNTKGQKVCTLCNGYFTKGTQSITWNGTDDQGNRLGSGVYFYRLTTAQDTHCRRMVLLK